MRRGRIVAGAGVLALVAALVLGGEALGGEPQGPPSSSYATDAQGLAAWASLLGHSGHPVLQLRTPLSHARLDPADTVVVLDPDALLPAEGARLLAFVRAGGRLLAGGREPQGTLPALLSSPPEWNAGAPERQLPAAGAGAVLAGVSEVRTAGEGRWSDAAGYRAPLQDADGASLLLERTLGSGTLALLADPSPLQNRLLDSAGNALFALRIVGGAERTVVFVESVHGFGESRGVAALPARWRLAFAVALLAGLVWILARARRLGPPEPTGETGPPPRGAYVQALALLLRRTREPGELSAALTRLRDGR